MVKVITQDTFDSVVKENVEEFGMEIAEAVQDAKEQFEKQGVNLGNIVISEQGSQVVVNAVKNLFKNEELVRSNCAKYEEVQMQKNLAPLINLLAKMTLTVG